MLNGRPETLEEALKYHKLLTSKEVASFLSCGMTKVKTLRDTGKLPIIRISEGKFLYKPEDVKRLIDEHYGSDYAYKVS